MPMSILKTVVVVGFIHCPSFYLSSLENLYWQFFENVLFNFYKKLKPANRAVYPRSSPEMAVFAG